MSKYTPATFQPTVRPDWAGVLSYLSDKEKSEILVALFKYPSVECESAFWLETIKPDLDLQYQAFQESCKAKARGVRNRWDKISITDVEDKDKTSITYDIVTEREREREEESKSESENENKGGVGEKETKENFEVFWNAYTPVRASDGFVVAKGSKKLAFEKYTKIIKSGVLPTDILKGLEAYIAYCQKNNRLTCGVPVFLNQERWKDDYNTPTLIAQTPLPRMSFKEMKEYQNNIEIQKILNGEK